MGPREETKWYTEISQLGGFANLEYDQIKKSFIWLELLKTHLRPNIKLIFFKFKDVFGIHFKQFNLKKKKSFP